MGYADGIPTTDFAGSVVALVAQEPGALANVRAVLQGMLQGLEKGESISVPDTTTPAAATQEVKMALSDLNEPSAATQQVRMTRSDLNEPSAAPTNDPSAPAAQAASSPGGPAFPVVGEPTHGGLIWSFVNSLGEPAFALKARNCNDETGCTETAYILGSGEISPSAVKSKINVKITTYLNLAGYKDIHFLASVYCYRNQKFCGSKNSRNLAAKGTRSGVIVLKSESQLYGSKISFSLELAGKAPDGYRITGGSTTRASCEKGPETVCRWRTG